MGSSPSLAALGLSICPKEPYWRKDSGVISLMGLVRMRLSSRGDALSLLMLRARLGAEKLNVCQRTDEMQTGCEGGAKQGTIRAMIEVSCPQCGLVILVPPSVRGRGGVCFGCGRPLMVPGKTASDSPKSLDFQQGQRITDRYIIDCRLGKGGMGVVYKAEDTLVQETVALKFMRPELLRTEKGQQLFVREAQIARRLRHENIVAVHDVGWTYDGILYLSMEFAQGQSLRQFLRKHRQERKLIDVRVGVRFVTEILRALEYAHRTVVHRDIKPENVMLSPGERVRVLDFGLAKAMHAESHESKGVEGKPKKVVGTLAYAAPEQVRLRDIDLRADIYAVGLVLYELLTLRTPLDETVPVGRVRGDVAPSIMEALDRALREERDQRWSSAGEFRKALKEAFETSYTRSVAKLEVGRREEEVSTEGMVYQEGGHFLMGNDGVAEESPEAEVAVSPFWIDRNPVTNREYEAFLEATGHEPPKYWRDSQFNGPTQPVVGVSWAEAHAYAEWAAKELPTEAQWEYAARGKENRPYPWGNQIPDTTRCNFREYLGMTSMTGMHEDGATPEGVQDLAGNVYEWTQDAYVPYTAQRQRPEATGTAPRKTVRGGCWGSSSSELRCAARKGLFPESQLNTVGFRCVLAAEETLDTPAS